MDIYSTILVILLCLLLEGFFSGSEIGIVSADQSKLRHAAAKGSRGARLALLMLQKPEWLLSVTLVGTNIAVVTNTTMATALMIQLFGEHGGWLAIVVIAPLIWVFGEIVPKSVFQQRADVVTPYVIYVLLFFSYLFYPVLLVFSFITRVLTRMTGGGKRNPFTLREEILTMLQMPAASDGDIHPVEKGMIRRMFNFSETTVQSVMLPLIDVVAVERGITCGTARQVSSQHAHVRLPVYDGRVDHICGVVHTLELLDVDPERPIADFIHPAYYVPAAKSIKELMLDFRERAMLVAVVVDEFGGATGIVTMEDIMEEVVEDLEDEYDEEPQATRLFCRMGENDYLVNARVEMDELCETLGIELRRGAYATLAGYMLDRLHSVPASGAVVSENDVKLTVHRATPQTVLEVRIRW